MTKVLVKVSADRELSLVPMQIELDFEEHMTTEEKARFSPFLVRMTDRKTGRLIPSQFSPLGTCNQLKGQLSWILFNQAQKEFEVEAPVRGGYSLPCRNAEGVKVTNRGDGQLEIFMNEEHVCSYVFNEAYERPFLYPAIGPDGSPVTRSIPNFGDHPHHKGIGLALGDVSEERGTQGVNFWGLGTIGDPKQGRVVHRRFTSIEQGSAFALIREENVWKQNDEMEGPTLPRRRWKVKKEGTTLLNEERKITVWNVSPMRIIDIHTVLTPAVDEVILNADVEKKEVAKENGPLVIRVADNMCGEAEGTIANSEGGRTERECWGRQARWVDYYGPVIHGGPVNGIAAMDHPSNIRHPTGWHVRDYGLFAANPFYDKKPEWPDQGPLYLSREKNVKLDLRYRIYIHRGDEEEGKAEQKWQEWVNPPFATIE